MLRQNAIRLELIEKPLRSIHPGKIATSFINFEGVGSAMYLWVNGKYIGYAEDSFTRDEFNIYR